MSSEIDKIKEIFLEAIENHSPDQWDDFLERSCKGNVVLRTNVQELLEGHVQGASLIDERSIATLDDPQESKIIGQQIKFGNVALRQLHQLLICQFFHNHGRRRWRARPVADSNRGHS